MAVHVVDFRRSGLGWRNPRPRYRRVDDAFFEPGVAPREHTPGQRRVRCISIVPELAEQLLRAQPGLDAEHVGELAGDGSPLGPVGLGVHLGADADGADREQLSADINNPAQEPLLALELALPACHRVKGGPGQLPAGPLGITQVYRERPELAVRAWPLALPGDQRGQPFGVELARVGSRPGA